MGPNFFSDTLLPITLAAITLALGLSIEVSELKNIFYYPRAILTGLFIQLLLLPLLAFILAFVSGIDPIFQAGIVLIAACPGGATSNLLTYMLNGNVALSVSLTAINSIVSLISTPFTVMLGLHFFLGSDTLIKLPFGHTVLNMLFIVIVPTIIGIIMRRYIRDFAIGLERPLRYILPVMLFIVYAGVLFIDEGAQTLHITEYISLYPMPILLNALSMVSGWLMARKMNLERRNQYTLSIETGLHNSTLAIYIAATLIGNQMMAVVPVIYGSFSFFSTWLIAYLIKKYGR